MHIINAILVSATFSEVKQNRKITIFIVLTFQQEEAK